MLLFGVNGWLAETSLLVAAAYSPRRLAELLRGRGGRRGGIAAPLGVGTHDRARRRHEGRGWMRLERRPEGDDRVSFLFQGEARGQDASDVFTRKWLVTVKRTDGAWKVSNFHEYD